jgi:hypothetical protein
MAYKLLPTTPRNTDATWRFIVGSPHISSSGMMPSPQRRDGHQRGRTRGLVLDGKGMKGALGVGHSVTFRTSPGRSISDFRVIVSRRFVSVTQ